MQSLFKGSNDFLQRMYSNYLAADTWSRWNDYPDIKAHGANIGPIWGRQDPGGPHVGPMNFVIWVLFVSIC